MEYIYAALLLHKLKQDITEDNVRNVIKSTGATPDDIKVKSLIAALSDINIDEALKAAPAAAVTAAAAAPPSSSPATSPTGAGAPSKEEEEKKEEKKEEEALEGLSALFG
jgi:large subunit ribosomal protein L12